MKKILVIGLIFFPMIVNAELICKQFNGCAFWYEGGKEICPECVVVEPKKPIIIKVVEPKKPIIIKKESESLRYKDSRWLSSLATHKRDTTPYNIKKPFVNDDGVEMCWFPELGWVSHLDSKGIPVNTGEYSYTSDTQ